MDWDRAGVVELEHGLFCSSCRWADGRLGEEERNEVQKGFWGQIPEEAVQHVAWYLVGTGPGGASSKDEVGDGESAASGMLAPMICRDYAATVAKAISRATVSITRQNFKAE